MAQRNMNNGRASRSAYNYDNDRPYGANARASEPPRRGEQRIQGIDSQRGTRGGNSSPRGTTPRGTTSRGTASNPRNVRPAGAHQGTRPDPNRGSQSARPKRNAQHNQSSARRPAPQKKQNSDWIYPEGYIPPRRTRPNGQRSGRPSQGHNDNAQRRPQNQRRRPAPEPKPIITVDWQRVGVIALALLGRFLICLAVAAGVMGLVYRSTFYSTPETPDKKVTYTFLTEEGEGDDKKISKAQLTFDAATAYHGEELYISFSEISKWLGTAQVGDVYSMRFVLGNGTESSGDVVFHNASQNAFVNGAPVVMRNVARFDQGEVWVPLSFVEDYLTGIEIVREDASLTLSKTENDVGFTLYPASPLTPAQPPEDE